MLTFSFNIFLLLILIGIIIIGYTTGVISEIKKIINLSVPLIIIYIWGRDITSWIYNSSQFQFINNKLSFIKIPYFDTVMMLLLVLIIIYIFYMITKMIVKVIDKKFHLEVVKYKLGDFNNYLGILFSIFRFYLIASILIVPFFILGFTSTNDFTTTLITKYPLPFTQLGKGMSEVEPVIEVTKSMQTLQEVIDINYLKAENTVIKDLKNKLDEYEDIIKNDSNYHIGSGVYPYLDDYINDDKKEYSEINKYEGLIIWINKEIIDLETIPYDALLTSFLDNYEEILNNTQNKSMKSN